MLVFCPQAESYAYKRDNMMSELLTQYIFHNITSTTLFLKFNHNNAVVIIISKLVYEYNYKLFVLLHCSSIFILGRY